MKNLKETPLFSDGVKNFIKEKIVEYFLEHYEPKIHILQLTGISTKDLLERALAEDKYNEKVFNANYDKSPQTRLFDSLCLRMAYTGVEIFDKMEKSGSYTANPAQKKSEQPRNSSTVNPYEDKKFTIFQRVPGSYLVNPSAAQKSLAQEQAPSK